MNAARTGVDDESTADEPFTSLIRKLTELGYTAADAVDGITGYAHPDGDGLLVTIDTARQDEARISRRNDDGDPTWMIRFTGDAPEQVQRAIVMLALRFGTGDQPAVPVADPDTVAAAPDNPTEPR
ncbi:hypothetical protein Vau01_122430 [Virgisporangium aurantiacum]|uniref:Uncharacterized protein n=2 Tax=Virgisporangium aurantiacum TaxID=175570 RepID=A0A8J3ZIH8_9ACTN|nr:hypothetical protein Vau01_122430 [Virgisporangium aurantiacum]